MANNKTNTFLGVREAGGNTSVALIGCGGIGSQFMRVFHRDIMHSAGALLYADGNPAADAWPFALMVFDPDVVEASNLRHQDFHEEEMGFYKAQLMAIRYACGFAARKFVETDCTKYDVFIIAADNPGVRKLVYEHCLASGKAFIDMRCEGATWALFTEKTDRETLYGSLGNDAKSEKGRSCQLAEDTAVGKIRHGHLAAAAAGADVILQRIYGEEYPTTIVSTVYGGA